MSHQIEIFDLGPVEVTVVRSAGPRILGYARPGGPQLFASLPGEVIHSATGDFAFIGGHRLWRAPEIPAVTYEPDDRPVGIVRSDRGIRVSGPADLDGITKTIEVRQEGPVTVVEHTLTNMGPSPVRCAAWGITQLAPGGTAVLPQPLEAADPAGVLPNRTMVFWAYTDPADIEFRRSEVRIHGSDAGRSKVGQPNRRGWMAYALDEEVFVKWSPLHDDALDYADLGASIECYRDHRFLELESLGPLTDLEPGAELRHREAWRLIPLGGRPLDDVLASLPETIE
jgi:hypothetical protein